MASQPSPSPGRLSSTDADPDGPATVWAAMPIDA